MGAAQCRQRQEREVARGGLGPQVERQRIRGWILLRGVAAVVEQPGEREELRAAQRETTAGVASPLRHSSLRAPDDVPAAVGVALAVAGVPGQGGLDPAEVGIARPRKGPGVGLLRGRRAAHLAIGEVVQLEAHAAVEDEIVSRVRDGAAQTEAEGGQFVRVARLVVLRRIRAQAEEAARERLAPAAVRAPVAALLLDHTTLGKLAVVDPAPPDSCVGLLALRRVADEEARELLAALLSKVDVGERQAAAEADVALDEHERHEKARDHEPREDVSRLDAALRDVAPALRVGKIGGEGGLGNAAARFDTVEWVVDARRGVGAQRARESEQGRTDQDSQVRASGAHGVRLLIDPRGVSSSGDLPSLPVDGRRRHYWWSRGIVSCQVFSRSSSSSRNSLRLNV
jgi:hypothetical protein